ncbi:exosortase family protein XrtF [Flavobacterium algicola]|uniref:exosortase family protein XrtF n=1 Tax=Flavobacterium algicola TaxID=556529 RepID=UPI001EFEE47B|nr:exosortase family protein XrtF [Flavobacterium algicola]MCG9791348.1 exosortase family protein XrtF [Flavobacterium algicola]
MKKYFIQYKPFLLFLSKFFLTYAVLAFLYQLYLNSFGFNKIDSITEMVGKNTNQLMNLFNADFYFEKDNTESYLKLFYNQKYVARIIEGCNAMSIIILFISFVVAFSGKLQTTIGFVFGGAFAIYILNISRIAILSLLLYFYPEHEAILHRVFFPLFIYGFVFLLWILWVNKFSFYAKKNTAT